MRTELVKETYMTLDEMDEKQQSRFLKKEMLHESNIQMYSEMQYQDWIQRLETIGDEYGVTIKTQFHSGSSYCYINDIKIDNTSGLMKAFINNWSHNISDIEYEIGFNHLSDKMYINIISCYDKNDDEIDESDKEMQTVIRNFMDKINEITKKVIDTYNNDYHEVLLYGTDDGYEEWLKDHLIANECEFLVKSEIIKDFKKGTICFEVNENNERNNCSFDLCDSLPLSIGDKFKQQFGKHSQVEYEVITIIDGFMLEVKEVI